MDPFCLSLAPWCVNARTKESLDASSHINGTGRNNCCYCRGRETSYHCCMKNCCTHITRVRKNCSQHILYFPCPILQICPCAVLLGTWAAWAALNSKYECTSNILCLKHLWMRVIQWAGKLTEEKFCVFNEIKIFQTQQICLFLPYSSCFMLTNPINVLL